METRGDRIVLFGGQAQGNYFGDTWEWDGTDWSERSFAPLGSPAPRSGHSLAHIGSRLVTSGGAPTGGVSDTVEWDGRVWSPKVVTGPAPRLEFRLAGAGTGRVVGFGGNSDFPGDTWLYSNIRLAGSDCASADDCLTGFCADSVCCDSACGGGAVDCLACGLDAGAAANGLCSVARVNVPCRGSVAACDLPESCDGLSPTCPADVLAPSSTQCQPPGCDGGIAHAASFCTGADATCPIALPQPCDPFVCAESECAASCVDDVDCIPGRRCEAGSCVVPLQAGAPCSSDHECASEHCVDGVCCDRQCVGSCEACDMPGKSGICSVITGAPPGSRGCQGTCSGERADGCVPIPGQVSDDDGGFVDLPRRGSGCSCGNDLAVLALASLYLLRRRRTRNG